VVRPSGGLAEVLRRHGPAYLATHELSPSRAKVWRAILACRTVALGGHVETCDGCGTTRHVHHSCRNRHCPQCQTRAKEAWLAQRRRELLPCLADATRRAFDRGYVPSPRRVTRRHFAEFADHPCVRHHAKRLTTTPPTLQSP